MHKSSYCGVNCEKCNVYVATAADDDALRLKVAEEWGQLYKREFSKEDINCDGCKSDKLFGMCALCDIKGCCASHGVSNCEDCGEFICERMQRFYEYHRTHDTGNIFD